MKLTAEIVERVKGIADGLDYDYIGFRVQEVPFALGEMNHRSHVWDDGDDTGEELGGVCAIDVRSMFFRPSQYGECYFGDYAAIVVGNHAEYGEDAGEIVISDPVVVEVIA